MKLLSITPTERPCSGCQGRGYMTIDGVPFCRSCFVDMKEVLEAAGREFERVIKEKVTFKGVPVTWVPSLDSN